jgi:hypothetical protein
LIHKTVLTEAITLPVEMLGMKSLHVLVLAFNHFTTIPEVLLHSQHSSLHLDSIIMAGNRIEKLTYDVLSKMQHIKKVDFRMNLLSLCDANRFFNEVPFICSVCILFLSQFKYSRVFRERISKSGM